MSLTRLLPALLFLSLSAHATTEGRVRLSMAMTDSPDSFQSHGTGLYRFDDHAVALSQAVVALSSDVYADWQFHSVLNAYSDGEQKAGVTQLFAQYRPLVASRFKPSLKVGVFYPALSVENTDIAWLSPHFLSNSAINSWIGEELRTGGIEFSLRRPGRQVRSPFTWSVHGAVFMGNDTTGTLLSWRGFAVHDRQSLIGDRINFPRWPAVVSAQSINAPAWTEPFREIDQRPGWYLGAHLAYKRTSEVRYYYYDNRANPNAINTDRLYGWRTRFHALSFRHFLSDSWQMYGQGLIGDTQMGNNVVRNDFHAAYVAVSYLKDKHRISARADWFKVIDNDYYRYDYNDSDGTAISLNYAYALSSSVSVSAEVQYMDTYAKNRMTVGTPTQQRDSQFQLAVTYSF